MPIHVELHRDPTIFSELTADWTTLLHNSPVNTIFLTPQWQGLWWKHFQAGRELRVLLARDTQGELVGIAPFYAAKAELFRAPGAPYVIMIHVSSLLMFLRVVEIMLTV